MLEDIKEIQKYSEEYNVPYEDLLLMSLNLTGVKSNLPYPRIRFFIRLNSFPDDFYVGLPNNICESPFEIKENKIYFLNEEIGKVRNIENDTCDETYFRRNKTALTLNSNSRSKCSGCKFCGTYAQDPSDRNNLLTRERLENKFNELEKMYEIDYSTLVEIAICTGCFSSENDVIEHLKLVREVADKRGFKGEIKYIGSQIVSEESLDFIEEEIAPFGYSLTVECFTRREQLMKPIKSNVTLDLGRDVLRRCKERGFNTTFLYILGLDPLDIISKETAKYLPLLTRFPVINLFQPYVKEHILLRDESANRLEYYLRVRKEMEKLFMSTDLRPRSWENYRPLWYTKFGEEDINDIRI